MKFKYIKKDKLKDEFYKLYFKFRDIVEEYSVDDPKKEIIQEIKLINEIPNLVKLINEVFENKYEVNIKFCDGHREKDEIVFTFGEVSYSFKPVIKYYIEETTKYKKFMRKQKKFDIDIFIFEVIFGPVFHEFIHCVQIHNINNQKLDLNTFMQCITIILGKDIDESIISYYNNPLEIEAHYCSYLFLKDIGMIVDKYNILRKSSLYLNNILVGLISDLDAFKQDNVLLSRNDLLIDSMYKLKHNKNDIFKKKVKNYHFINKIFFSDHISNLKELMNDYVLYPEQQESLEKLYSYLLLYEIKFVDINSIKLEIDNLINKYGYNDVYKLFSNIYDLLINNYNKLYCKYTICYNLPYCKYFKNQLGLTKKMLNEKIKNTWILNDRKIELIRPVIEYLETKNN